MFLRREFFPVLNSLLVHAILTEHKENEGGIKMKRKSIVVMVSLLAVFLLITGCGNKDGQETGEGTGDSTYFGDFEAETLDGEVVDETIFAQADLTMVKVWATYCGYCIDEMEYYQELNNQFADRGLQTIGVVTDIAESDKDLTKKILADNQTDYVNLLFNGELQNGLLGQVQALPPPLFVDKEGNLVGEPVVGMRDVTEWETLIETYLQEVSNE